MRGTITSSFPEVALVAGMFHTLLQQYSLFTLTGVLGAGKTTLVQELLAHYGIQEPVVSPTFTYLQVYKKNGFSIYHFDLYRLTTLAEFEEAGFKEYLYQPNSLAIIEWPEIIMPLLDHQACHANLAYTRESTQRTITWYTVP